jgi:hypothetical protein
MAWKGGTSGYGAARHQGPVPDGEEVYSLNSEAMGLLDCCVPCCYGKCTWIRRRRNAKKSVWKFGFT